MTDPQASLFCLIGITISLFIIFTVYIFARFSYHISQDYLRLRQRVLIFIPFSSFKIKTKKIKEVRRFNFKKDILRGGVIYGNVFRKKGVMIILKSWSIRGKRIFITPENPDKFIEEMNSIIHSNSQITPADAQ